MEERTLVLIKPDAMAKHLAGNIITDLYPLNLKMIALKLSSVKRELAEMHYSLFKSNELQVLSKENYEVVVRARFDQQFLDGLNLNKTNYICLPNVGQFGGFNDQFAYGPPELMNRFCDLVKFGNEYVRIGIGNAEDFIRKHLDIQKIPATEVNIPYRLIRANGSVVQFYNGHKTSLIKKDFGQRIKNRNQK
jgi:hypothetical protein